MLVRCGLVGFGVAGFLIELQFDVRTRVYDEMYAARSNVCLAIARTLGALEVSFVNAAPR